MVTFDSVVEEEALNKMIGLLMHRGPDDQGIKMDGVVGLGHTRLSILDLSSKGHQPMPNDDGTLWIVYNGEVYNYLELQIELEAKGFVFRSNTDTEVILKAYECWGEDCLQKFNGMFSFIIHDKKKKILFGARDRFGIKPFYYHWNKQKFLFSSEIKPLFSQGIKPETNKDLVYNFLVYQSVGLTSDTFFKGIKKLLPGHWLRLDLDSRTLKVGAWWDLKAKVSNRGDDEAVKEFKQRFIDSVKLRLRSDVPVGSCLSGGLDSSSIVCTMSNLLGKDSNIKTFSSDYSFDFPGNEVKYIKEVAKKCDVENLEIEPTSDKLLEDLDSLIYFQEEPFSGLTPFAQWEVMKLAHSHDIKVLLDGQGADEALAGYTSYFGTYFVYLASRLKIFRLSREIIGYKKIHGSVPTKNMLMLMLYLAIPSSIKKKKKRKAAYFVSDEFEKLCMESKSYPYLRGLRPLNNALINSLRVQLIHLLRYEDKSSMAYSIETRLPFLDFRLIEDSFTLPSNMKLREGKSKYVLRKAMEGVLPDKISLRYDKVGFAIPEELWLKKEHVWKLVSDTLLSDRTLARRIITRSGIEKLLADFQAGDQTATNQIWSLFVLEKWFRIFIDAECDPTAQDVYLRHKPGKKTQQSHNTVGQPSI